MPARDHARGADYERRFGLSSDAVRPLFGEFIRGRPSLGPPPRGLGIATVPQALAVYEPGLSAPQRLLARLGTSRTVTFGLPPRPMSTKGLASVGVGAVAGMMLAQPFDALTFVAPLYGLAIGAIGGGVGWRVVKGRRASTIEVEDWRPQLEAIRSILQNADRIGQPFASPPALRMALHSALWHAVHAVDEPGGRDIIGAFDEQLDALRVATETTLVELESPSIAERKAAVTQRLADATGEIGLGLPTIT